MDDDARTPTASPRASERVAARESAARTELTRSIAADVKAIRGHASHFQSMAFAVTLGVAGSVVVHWLLRLFGH